jgi:hypothetical protein
LHDARSCILSSPLQQVASHQPPDDVRNRRPVNTCVLYDIGLRWGVILGDGQQDRELTRRQTDLTGLFDEEVIGSLRCTMQ